MTHDEMIAVIAAHKEGKKIQVQNCTTGQWAEVESPNWSFNIYDYRIKPEPKIRPWLREEVPVGGLVKYKETQDIYLILGARKDACYEVIIPLGVSYTRDEMLKLFEHSTDHGKTWKICGVVE